MKPVVEDVIRQALSLDEDGRAEVAARVLDSLEQADAEAKAGWLTEFERRAAELESGADQGIPWEDLYERLMHGHRGR